MAPVNVVQRTTCLYVALLWIPTPCAVQCSSNRLDGAVPPHQAPSDQRDEILRISGSIVRFAINIGIKGEAAVRTCRLNRSAGVMRSPVVPARGELQSW